MCPMVLYMKKTRIFGSRAWVAQDLTSEIDYVHVHCCVASSDFDLHKWTVEGEGYYSRHDQDISSKIKQT